MKFSELKTDENGLVPAVVQNFRTGKVLMLGYMNEEAFNDTLRTGKVCFYSRSRKTQWLKGETSGNTQELVELRYDCDADTLLALVHPAGPACHTGNTSCFYRSLT